MTPTVAFRPEPPAERAARHDVARPLEQRRQDAERLILQRHAQAALPELAAPEAQLEDAEPDNIPPCRPDYLHVFLIAWILS